MTNLRDDEEFKEWVRKSRAAQGLPPTITDPTALAKIARMLLSEQKRASSK